MFFSCNVAFSSMPVFLPTIIEEYVILHNACIKFHAPLTNRSAWAIPPSPRKLSPLLPSF